MAYEALNPDQRIANHKQNVADQRLLNKKQKEVYGMGTFLLNTILQFVPDHVIKDIGKNTDEWKRFVPEDKPVKPSKLQKIDFYEIELEGEKITLRDLVIATYANCTIGYVPGTISIEKKAKDGTPNTMTLFTNKFGVDIDFNGTLVNRANAVHTSVHSSLADKLFDIIESLPEKIAQSVIFRENALENQRGRLHEEEKKKLKELGILDF
ncbi:hypothetical protein HYZ98_03670 [Candidatus Peregrinibacteria bacterium]|nr:hypothetical protein [Candidatus Peregrinibacteria bacterium]